MEQLRKKTIPEIVHRIQMQRRCIAEMEAVGLDVSYAKQTLQRSEEWLMELCMVSDATALIQSQPRRRGRVPSDARLPLTVSENSLAPAVPEKSQRKQGQS
jgi:hypothetical protein